LSYSALFAQLYKDQAVYAKRVLSGEKPSNLPVQQPTKFELVLNMKTANALGLTFSGDFLSVVDRLIE
jgi:putative ABC transport system substrate-binding protein